jgi:hypothetical protein
MKERKIKDFQDNANVSSSRSFFSNPCQIFGRVVHQVLVWTGSSRYSQNFSEELSKNIGHYHRLEVKRAKQEKTKRGLGKGEEKRVREERGDKGMWGGSKIFRRGSDPINSDEKILSGVNFFKKIELNFRIGDEDATCPIITFFSFLLKLSITKIGEFVQEGLFEGLCCPFSNRELSCVCVVIGWLDCRLCFLVSSH